MHYFVIPFITVVTALAGSWFSSQGIASGWYDSITKPSWTPSGSVIGSVWTVIFILSTVAALLFWHRHPRNRRFVLLVALFLANAGFNVLWSALFFGLHLIGWSVVASVALEVSVLALMQALWRPARTAALLLAPYAAWVAFATYLTYAVWWLNR